MTVLVRVGAVVSRRFGFELVKPSSVVVSGVGSSATVSNLGSVEFSSCTSLSLNGVFQSGYDNYMIVTQGTSSFQNTTTLWADMRLRVGGVDASGSDYTWQLLWDSTTTTIAGQRSADTAWSRFLMQTGERHGYTIFVYGPNLAQPTAMRYNGASSHTGTNAGLIATVAGTHSLSTAYDGFTLTVLAGTGTRTLSGRLAVNGMRG